MKRVSIRHRKGHLTPSAFGAVCHTSVDKPSQSLVLKILQRCPPPKSDALKWDNDNDSKARAVYEQAGKTDRNSFRVKIADLIWVPPTRCCGDGLLEIKCPYCVRHATPANASYLKTTEDGYGLLQMHDYFFQVQSQLAVLERSFCNFVFWLPHGLHIKRIPYDQTFFNQMCWKLQQFFIE